jgi:hypothetical protein
MPRSVNPRRRRGAAMTTPRTVPSTADISDSIATAVCILTPSNDDRFPRTPLAAGRAGPSTD